MQGTLSVRLLFWIISISLVFYILSLVHSILWPFIISAIVAYVLTPVVDILERYGLPRWSGAVLLVLAFIGLIVGFFALIFPLVVQQMQQIITLLPTALAKAQQILAQYGVEIPDLSNLGLQLQTLLREYLGQSLQMAAKQFSNILNGAFLMVLVPVIMFYMLKDIHRVVPIMLNCVPLKNRGFAVELIQSLDNTVSAFFRGQLVVMVVLGGLYTLGLSLIGLEYAVAVGVLVGVLSFIPYVGSFVGVFMATLLAIVQFTDPKTVLLVWLVHAIAQTLEGMVLTPNIVGDKVGLNPVWLIFALLVFGGIMGFLGVLLAVPMAAIIGMTARVIYKYYVQSDFYKDV